MYVQVPSCVHATYFNMYFFFGWVIKLPGWVTSHLLLTRGWVKNFENSRALRYCDELAMSLTQNEDFCGANEAKKQ